MQRHRGPQRNQRARALARSVVRGTDIRVSQPEGDLSDEEIEDLLPDRKWLDNWTDGMCELTGAEPGTPEFRECKRNMSRKALSAPLNPVRALAPLRG